MSAQNADPQIPTLEQMDAAVARGRLEQSIAFAAFVRRTVAHVKAALRLKPQAPRPAEPATL